MPAGRSALAQPERPTRWSSPRAAIEGVAFARGAHGSRWIHRDDGGPREIFRRYCCRALPGRRRSISLALLHLQEGHVQDGCGSGSKHKMSGYTSSRCKIRRLGRSRGSRSRQSIRATTSVSEVELHREAQGSGARGSKSVGLTVRNHTAASSGSCDSKRHTTGAWRIRFRSISSRRSSGRGQSRNESTSSFANVW
jgi:hypothetical protein